jgi:hypothetical protein
MLKHKHLFFFSPTFPTVTVKLDHTNYLMWKFQITGILDAYSLLDHLEDPTSCPSQFVLGHNDHDLETQEVNPLYLQWKTRDKRLFSLISSTLSPSTISLVMGQTTASGIWRVILNKYTSISRSSFVNLKRELHSIKKNSDSVTQYLQKIKEARDKLVSVGVFIDDEEILHIVLQGLPSDFHSFTSAMLTKNEAVRFEELHTLMKTEEDLLKSAMDNSREIAHVAMVANKNSQPSFHTPSTAPFNGNRGRVEIRVSTIVVEVMGGSRITIPVVVLRVISIMGMPSPISVRIPKIPNLGIQALVLVLPARSATSLDIQRFNVINA